MKTLEDKLLFWVFLLVILVENKSRNKHVESLLIRRLDEGSIPSDELQHFVTGPRPIRFTISNQVLHSFGY